MAAQYRLRAQGLPARSLSRGAAFHQRAAVLTGLFHKIAFKLVKDRRRLGGVSKYTNLGRALVGLYDHVGVSWLRKRTQILPLVPPQETTSGCKRRDRWG